MSDEFRNYDRLSKMYEAMTVERNKMRMALKVFADPLSWRRDGSCDPNSGNFSGQQIAQDALAHVGNSHD